jgi:hypothetical protein
MMTYTYHSGNNKVVVMCVEMFEIDTEVSAPIV